MGALCSVDKYKQINQKYSTDFIKLIISEKLNEFLERATLKIKTQIEEQSVKLSTMALRNVKQKECEIHSYFSKVKERLDKNQKGGIQSLQIMTKSKIENIMSKTYFDEKYKNLREQIITKFAQQQEEMSRELTQITDHQRQILKQLKPRMMLFSDLDSPEKTDIIKRGEREHKNAIQSYRNMMVDTYGDKLKIQYYLNRLRNLYVDQVSDNLLQIAKDKFIVNYHLLLAKKIYQYEQFDK